MRHIWFCLSTWSKLLACQCVFFVGFSVSSLPRPAQSSQFSFHAHIPNLVFTFKKLLSLMTLYFLLFSLCHDPFCDTYLIALIAGYRGVWFLNFMSEGGFPRHFEVLANKQSAHCRMLVETLVSLLNMGIDTSGDDMRGELHLKKIKKKKKWI